MSSMASSEEQDLVHRLQASWVWVPKWIDSSEQNTGARLVTFSRSFSLSSKSSSATLHISADTRYKLVVNGTRVAVGPARGSSQIWFYDTVDIAPYLRVGENQITVHVLRFFASSRGGMPFERTAMPGLTVVGGVKTDTIELLDLSSSNGWLAQVDDSTLFPTGLVDDGFLHIYERRSADGTELAWLTPRNLDIKTVNGELSPWRLRPRSIPMPVSTSITVHNVRSCKSCISAEQWESVLYNQRPTFPLPANSWHVLEVQADVHSTAFVRWKFTTLQSSHVNLKVTYSEGYELKPRQYPFFRTKTDRWDAASGLILGPHDEVTVDIAAGRQASYEPFWFRTFGVMRLEIKVGPGDVEFIGLEATQVNYPMSVKGGLSCSTDTQLQQMWDVSVRTMRNCMFDGYSDCPFYEQLQYSGDTRAVGLFHYLLSGDDRLMRQAITMFASSVTPEGLTQSRFPSHVPQLVAAFPLLWILQVCDHHLYFGDTPFARTFIPRIDEVLEFFDRHVDELGLISGLPDDVWQYVDWVATWGATEEHPDKGVPTSGRRSNRHSYFSMLCSYVLRQAARLLRDVGRPGNATEYESRAGRLTEAVRQHCYDGRLFTDSTSDIADELSYSQHCQVFGVLCGAVKPEEAARVLHESFIDAEATGIRFSKCSYMMQFYALRAFSLAGDNAYESYWKTVWNPWRKMLKNNMTTWEEDDVRQRSDCHAWGSVPIYEFCTELAGLHVLDPGCTKILLKPRVSLTRDVNVVIALGSNNTAKVSWSMKPNGGGSCVDLYLDKPVAVLSQLHDKAIEEHGVVQNLRISLS